MHFTSVEIHCKFLGKATKLLRGAIPRTRLLGNSSTLSTSLQRGSVDLVTNTARILCVVHMQQSYILFLVHFRQSNGIQDMENCSEWVTKWILGRKTNPTQKITLKSELKRSHTSRSKIRPQSRRFCWRRRSSKTMQEKLFSALRSKTLNQSAPLDPFWLKWHHPESDYNDPIVVSNYFTFSEYIRPVQFCKF